MDQLPVDDGAIIGAVAEACCMPEEEVSLDLSVQDLGLDSYSMTAVISRVEAASGLEFSTEEIITLLQAETVGDFVALIHRLASAERAAAT